MRSRATFGVLVILLQPLAYAFPDDFSRLAEAIEAVQNPAQIVREKNRIENPNTFVSKGVDLLLLKPLFHGRPVDYTLCRDFKVLTNKLNGVGDSEPVTILVVYSERTAQPVEECGSNLGKLFSDLNSRNFRLRVLYRVEKIEPLAIAYVIVANSITTFDLAESEGEFMWMERE